MFTFFKKYLGRIIIPSQTRNFPLLNLSEINPGIEHENFLFPVTSQAALDVLILKRSNGNAKYIVYLQANDMAYEETLEDVQRTMQILNCNAVLFNYRGVANSRGHLISGNDLVSDVIALIKFLINRRSIPADHIFLLGRSIGAGIGIIAASSLHQEGIPVKIFADRPFATMSLCIYGLIRTCFENPDKLGFNTQHKFPQIGSITASILFPLIKLLLYINNWELDVATAYKMLPQEDKEYVQVLSSKSDCSFENGSSRHIDDLIIHRSASLHVADKSYRTLLKHTVADFPSQAGLLEQVRKRKLAGNNQIDGHKPKLNELHSRHAPESSGEDILRSFINKFSI